MKLLITIILLTSFSSSLYSEEGKVPCRYKDGSLGLNSLDTFDCKLANKISSQESIQLEYKIHVEKKLANYIARQTSDLIEDLAMLDSYFDQNGIDLGKNKSVQDSCKLEKIAAVKCPPEVTKTQINRKLSYILSSDKYLPKDKDNQNLYKRMLSKAMKIRGGDKLKEANKCPVEGNSGFFSIDSQFTSSDAKTLIAFIKKGERNLSMDKMFENYPQLKMLVSGKDNSLKSKFFDAMKSYSGDNSEKRAVDDFFKDISVQGQMALSVSHKCDELEKSIQKFVCVEDKFPHLAMNEDDRDLLFESDKEKDDPIFKEVSRGLSCEMESKEYESEESNPINSLGTIHNKLEGLVKNVKKERDNTEVNEKVDLFCSLYLCKDSLVQDKMLSCKSGGPISSTDLLLTCPEGKLQKCEAKMQKFISYINNLERDAFNSGSSKIAYTPIDNNISPDGTSQKPRGFSSFYQNFLGVEGTIAAEGKKITPITIAEKSAEFKERKLDTAPSLIQSKDAVRSDFVRNDQRQEPITPEVEETTIVADSNPSRSSDFSRSFQTQFAKPNYDVTKDASGKNKKVKFTDTDSSTAEEMRKLRTELADAIGKVKGTDEEKLAAVADNNLAAVTPKGSSKDPLRNQSAGEKERLDQYRDSLNNWENRLRNWQGNLSDRDVRNNNNATTASEARPEGAAVAANDQYNSANAGATAKLTRSSAGASGGANADGTGLRVPAEKVENETGVVKSENLATMDLDSLKKMGIAVADSFIIKVRHKDKLYSVPVKTFNHNGKSMYVPLLNEKDRELSKIVYESPLFKDYRSYQIERQYKLEQN